MPKYGKTVTALLFEAFRRNDMADEHEKSKPIHLRWLGLGTAAAYRPVIKAGLMAFHDGRIPPRGCMGWLCLTEKGIATLEENRKEFEESLKKLKATTSYQNSFMAHYMLAGGFVRK